MIGTARGGVFARMFGSALTSQALLSAANFGVALLLLRHTTDLQYSYYILITGGIILAVSLQNSYIAPAMVNRMTRLSPAECGDLTGGLYREQWRIIVVAGVVATIITTAFWFEGLFDTMHLLLGLAAIAATVMALRREFFRMVLLAYRRAWEVLRGDVTYCVLLVAGVLLATTSTVPAAAAVLALGLAALVASLFLSRALRRREAWNEQGTPGILREIAPLASWSVAGAAVHWSFSQGYTWLVAATLEVSAVAAIAATRLLAMPVNLLTTGIGSLMLPLVSRWLHESGAPTVLRRLFWFALGIGAAAACYFTVLWFLRDWVFAVLLKKQFAQRDTLLMLWSASFVLMAINQQLLWLLVARQRFHRLTSLGLVSAVVGLSCSYWGMLRYGGLGAPLGILVGEGISSIGLAILCWLELAAKADPTDDGSTATTTTPLAPQVMPQVALPGARKPDFGRQPVVGSHGLVGHELFTDAALIALLDRFPREHLYALHMGTDPTRIDQNRLALHDGVSGAEMLRAVRNGRLWLNLTRVDRADARYGQLIGDLYRGLAAQVPGFSPDASQGTLLISSPGALVYYHADGPASVLWHVRGRKRVWVYPALDTHYMTRELLEDIFAGVRHEYLPYHASLDAGAQVYDLEPGQWIAWAQNAPHRVTNLDSLNVSLSTEHFTRSSRRRARIYIANRFFRTRLGWTGLAAREDGVLALAKVVAQRIARRLRLDPVRYKRHVAVLRVSADAPAGVMPLVSSPLATGSGT